MVVVRRFWKQIWIRLPGHASQNAAYTIGSGKEFIASQVWYHKAYGCTCQLSYSSVKSNNRFDFYASATHLKRRYSCDITHQPSVSCTILETTHLRIINADHLSRCRSSSQIWPSGIVHVPDVRQACLSQSYVFLLALTQQVSWLAAG